LKTYYTLYKITNNINNKIYIGVHKTNNLDDDYMGSGKYLKCAIEKYGIENFTKEILETYNSPEEMFNAESLIVNEDFVKRKDTYNIKEGGFGGWDHIKINGMLGKKQTEKHKKALQLYIKNNIKKISENMKNKWKDPIYKEKMIQNGRTAFLDKCHTNITKQKMSISQQGKQLGNKNPQYGTCWIYSPIEEKNKKIKKEELQEWTDKGWIKGRKMKF